MDEQFPVFETVNGKYMIPLSDKEKRENIPQPKVAGGGVGPRLLKKKKLAHEQYTCVRYSSGYF